MHMETGSFELNGLLQPKALGNSARVGTHVLAVGATETRLTLADLPRKSTARIVSVPGNDASDRRLRELGLNPGTEIEFCHRAPLGDPCCYGFRGTRICLRRSEAERILIELPTEQ